MDSLLMPTSDKNRSEVNSVLQMQSYNLRFLATVGNNLSQNLTGTKIQLTIKGKQHMEEMGGESDEKTFQPPSSNTVEMSIEQFEKLYNVLSSAVASESGNKREQ